MTDMTRDVVLVTVDALRADAVSKLPRTSHHFEEATQATAITAGAATNWVFPALLSGSYYTDAYNDAGTLADGLVSLPDVLAAEGYSTGAFLGFNPYLSKWRRRFDEFWNGGLTGRDEQWYAHPVQKWLNRGYRTALLQKRVAGSTVLERAREWYDRQSGPCFLWVHLMEPHKPYYPGLRAGREIGLLSVYRSVVNLQRYGDDIPERDLQVQRRLYEKCVQAVDRLLAEFLKTIDRDAATVVIGDHGEEFDHGHLGHERLYDECVQVPIFAENVPPLDSNETVRQIDVPGALLQACDVDIPPDWEGRSVQSLSETPAFMLTPEPSAGLLHAGVRTDTEKLIHSFDRETGERRQEERYDLDADPGERNDRSETDPGDTLETRLTEFVAEHEPALEMDAVTGLDSAAVEDRLKHLGYR